MTALGFARVVLALCAFPFALIGLGFLLAPETMAARVDVSLGSTTADHDVRAVYGGLQLGCAAAPAPRDHFYRIEAPPPARAADAPLLAGTLSVQRLRADALTDESSLLRVINYPPRGVGRTTIDRALEFATEQGVPVSSAFQRHAEAGITERTAKTVTGLLGRLKALQGRYPRPGQLVELVQRLVEEVAYRDEVRRLYPDDTEFEQRWSGVTEVLNFAENFARKRKGGGLVGFLNELTLTATDRQDEDGTGRLCITLMTIHASKGLEYPRVYLVGMEEGLLPHKLAAEEDTIDEERRLASRCRRSADRRPELRYEGQAYSTGGCARSSTGARTSARVGSPMTSSS